MTYNEKAFCKNVIVAVLRSAMTDAKHADSSGIKAREWLVSEFACHLADGVGVDPAYWRRIVPHSWKTNDGTRRHSRPAARVFSAEEKMARKEKARVAAELRRAKEFGLTRKQMAFVDAFRELGDVEMARQKVGSDRGTVRKWLKQEKITRLMYELSVQTMP